jgi:protein-tyrosine phosphatase
LLRCAVNNGINRIVLTPHVHPGRYANTLFSLRAHFERFSRAVLSAQIPVSLALGGEVRLCDDVLPMLDRDEVPLLESASGEKILLLEFPHSHVPAGCMVFLRWLKQRGITALIAHPERNKELMGDPQRLKQFIDEGCLVQVTAAAVIGNFGKRAQQSARYFLDRNWVTVLATDAHNVQHRPPLLREAAEAVASWYGDERAEQLVEIAPAELSARSFSKANPLLPSRKPMLALDAPAQLSMEVLTEVPASRNALRAQLMKSADGNICESAFTQMRSELVARAHQPGIDGVKAAKILQLMNRLEVH